MCPACVTTTALVVAGAVSTGGATAFAVKKVYNRLKNGGPDNWKANRNEE